MDFVSMNSISDALENTTLLNTHARLRGLEQAWRGLTLKQRSYALVDLGMRLGRLTVTTTLVSDLDALTERFRTLEADFLRSL